MMSIFLYLFVLPNEKKESFHPLILMFLFLLHFYFGLEILYATITTIACKILQVELEKPFDRPYLSTSTQDFWGKRWNVMVSHILHPTVYEPMVKAFSHVIGRNWAPIPAVVVTFMVSGLMHELIYYNLKHKNGTWEAWEPCWDSLIFFFIHGVFVALQIAYKKTFKPKQQLLPRIVSCLLTLAFVMTTTLTLFFPVFVKSAER
jgi:D-alanyl-lipoteichoic acid acyltransferase DltB (MBOAT superfamily)